MRKVLSFVLVLALVLGSFSMAFAATPSDVVGQDCQEAVDVLMGLGVVNGYEDGTFKPDQAVTRAEMAKLIVVALGLEDYAIGTSKFTDMAGYGWAQGYVAYATGLGVVKGYPDGTFKPGQTVTYDEAAAMIVRALGYTDESLTGTWPANYVVKAKALGILDDVKSAMGGANRGDIAQMLYNSLTLDIGYVNNDGDWTANSEVSLEDLVQAFIDEEDVEGNPDNMLVRLGATFNAKDVIYGDEDSVISLRPYVGAYAATYTNDDDEIIVVVPDSEFLTGEYSEDDDEFQTDDVDYNADDVSGATVDFFYNGVLDGETALGYLDGDGDLTIAADVSGKTLKDIYSIAMWEITDYGFAGDNDLEDITDDQELFGYEFALDDDDEIDLNSFEIVGADSLDKIAEDDVVYVYVDDDDEYIRKVAVGTEVVTGEITKISSDDEYTINGTKYDLADVMDGDSEDVAAGDEVNAYLDAYGDIYSFEMTEGTADDFAVALDYADGEEGLNGDSAAVKLFLNDETDEVFDVDDEATTSDDEDLLTVDGDITWNVVPSVNLVLYGTDDDGVIDTMDVFSADNYYDNDDYTFVAEDTNDVTAKGYYDGKAIATDAVIFNVADLGSDDEDDYTVVDREDILDTDDVTAVYVLNDDTNKIVAMIVEDVTATDDSYGVFTDWAETSGDYDYEVTALIDGDEVVASAEEAVAMAADSTAPALYVISYDSSDAFKDAIDIADDTDEDTNLYGVTYAYEDDMSVDGWTLDDEVVVYTWDAEDEVYDAGRVNDIDGDYDAVLVDLDGDEVIDIVLIGDEAYDWYDYLWI